jgi:octanoyl-[GcvH]:protein N-octanoyltransferase
MSYHCVILHQKGPIEELVHQDRLFALSLTNQEIGLRFYETHGVILGKLDQTCSNFQEGVEYLHKQGYPTTIREQGGLGVVVDEGVLNVSIILPTSLKPYSGLYDAYDTMVMLFKEAFSSFPYKLYFYEIENSYCPGKYDGVINHKKWCGLAQKRMKDKVIISATIMVNGHQNARGNLMKTFYEIANQNNDTRFPNIDPESMTTLSDALEQSLTISESIKLIQSTVKAWVQHL